jgi:hypothetical protein
MLRGLVWRVVITVLAETAVRVYKQVVCGNASIEVFALVDLLVCWHR